MPYGYDCPTERISAIHSGLMNETIKNPYLRQPGTVWLRGNLHTHTTNSDGALPPQDAIDAYAKLGYDFLAISDHDLITATAGLNHRGMVILPAREMTGAIGHVLLVGAGCDKDFGGNTSQQDVIDSVMAAGGLAVLCHPSWGKKYNHYSIEQMCLLSGYAGIEVFNGTMQESPGGTLALDKWDMLLGERGPVWGFAHDDVHAPNSVGLGWNMVLAAARTQEAIIAAIRAGSFYASTGVTIDKIETDGSVLRVDAANADAIAVIGESSVQLAWAEAPRISFDAKNCQSPMVRIECYGRANRRAWTQPFVIRRP